MDLKLTLGDFLSFLFVIAFLIIINIYVPLWICLGLDAIVVLIFGWALVYGGNGGKYKEDDYEE